MAMNSIAVVEDSAGLDFALGPNMTAGVSTQASAPDNAVKAASPGCSSPNLT
jgi:hypothetical protein